MWATIDGFERDSHEANRADKDANNNTWDVTENGPRLQV